MSTPDVPPRPVASELLQQAGSVRSDLRLVEQALTKKWQIPEQAYNLIPASLLQIVTARDERDKKTYIHPARTRILASELLRKLHNDNQRLQALDRKLQEPDRDPPPAESAPAAAVVNVLMITPDNMETARAQLLERASLLG